MPSYSLLLGVGVVLSTLTSGTVAAQYEQKEKFTAKNWLDAFHFETYDKNFGFVDYQTEAAAKAKKLYRTDAATGDIVFGVDGSEKLDYMKDTGRKSVRLEGNKEYNHGLFILDVKKMPGACGMWPAFWSLGRDTVAEPWPLKGEIDIIENVNGATQAKSVLHTSTQCKVKPNDQTGTADLTDCALDTAGSSGCGVTNKQPSFGPGLGASGGYYVMEWTSDAIKVWYFTRNNVPATLTTENPDTSKFGPPVADFAGDCNIDQRFKDHRFIFTNNFCGEWAGQEDVYRQSGCPTYSGLTAAASCRKYVAENPTAFANQNWQIGSFRTFQQKSVISSSSARPSSSSMVSSSARSSSASASSSAVRSSSSSAARSSSAVSSVRSSSVLPSSTPARSSSAVSSSARASSSAVSSVASSSGRASSSPAVSSVASSSGRASSSSAVSSSASNPVRVASISVASSAASSSMAASSIVSSSAAVSSAASSSVAAASVQSSVAGSSSAIISQSSGIVSASSVVMSSAVSSSPVPSPAPVANNVTSSALPSSSPISFPVKAYGNYSAPISIAYPQSSPGPVYNGNAQSTPCTTSSGKASSTPGVYGGYAVSSPVKNDYPYLPSFTPVSPVYPPTTSAPVYGDYNQPSISKTTITTTYTSTYVDVCETGYTTIKTTYAVTYCPTTTPPAQPTPGKPNNPGYPPIGWKITTKVCNACQGTKTVTVTVPCNDCYQKPTPPPTVPSKPVCNGYDCQNQETKVFTTKVFTTKIITITRPAVPQSSAPAKSSVPVVDNKSSSMPSQPAKSTPVVPFSKPATTPPANKPTPPVGGGGYGNKNSTVSISYGTGIKTTPTKSGYNPPVFTGAAATFQAGGIIVAGAIAAFFL